MVYTLRATCESPLCLIEAFAMAQLRAAVTANETLDCRSSDPFIVICQQPLDYSTNGDPPKRNDKIHCFLILLWIGHIFGTEVSENLTYPLPASMLMRSVLNSTAYVLTPFCHRSRWICIARWLPAVGGW